MKKALYIIASAVLLFVVIWALWKGGEIRRELEAEKLQLGEAVEALEADRTALEQQVSEAAKELEQLAAAAAAAESRAVTAEEQVEALTAEVERLQELIHGSFPLTADEYRTVCSMVMGEAGGESERGILLVAQAIRDGCETTGVQPSDLRSLYQYQGWNSSYSRAVEEAVTDVFLYGDRAVAEPVLYFYNADLVDSAWHESQTFVTQEGSVRYFH